MSPDVYQLLRKLHTEKLISADGEMEASVTLPQIRHVLGADSSELITHLIKADMLRIKYDLSAKNVEITQIGLKTTEKASTWLRDNVLATGR